MRVKANLVAFVSSCLLASAAFPFEASSSRTVPSGRTYKRTPFRHASIRSLDWPAVASCMRGSDQPGAAISAASSRLKQNLAVPLGPRVQRGTATLAPERLRIEHPPIGQSGRVEWFKREHLWTRFSCAKPFGIRDSALSSGFSHRFSAPREQYN